MYIHAYIVYVHTVVHVHTMYYLYRLLIKIWGGTETSSPVLVYILYKLHVHVHTVCTMYISTVIIMLVDIIM